MALTTIPFPDIPPPAGFGQQGTATARLFGESYHAYAHRMWLHGCAQMMNPDYLRAVLRTMNGDEPSYPILSEFLVVLENHI